VTDVTRALGVSDREVILGEVSVLMRDGYVFTEIGGRVAGALLVDCTQLARVELENDRAWAKALTRWLRTESGDPHIALAMNPVPRPVSVGPRDELVEREADPVQAYAAINFGFQRIEVLPTNVGYIHVTTLLPLVWAEATARAAMQFLAHVRAVVFDLRVNRGGASEMVALLASYWFAQPRELCSLVSPRDAGAQTNCTYAAPFCFADDLPICVLVSRRTASAAESFAYDLRRLGRAEIVGEHTAGAAHAIRAHRLHPTARLVLPYARAVDPDGANWQGTGVPIDVPCPSEHALARALERLGGPAPAM